MGKRNRSQNKKRRFDVITVILVVILVVGIGVIAYPTVSDYWNSLHMAQVVASYIEAVEDMTDEVYAEYLADAQAYNNNLLSKSNQWDLDDSDNEWYDNALNIGGSGVMGTIDIPSINVSLPIYHGTSDGVLRVGVGHLEGTSLPVGGKGTHAVLSGHRGLTTAKLFTDLDKVVVGDYFYITVLNETLAYEVDQILIVEPEDTSALAIDPDEDYVTLLTCTPYGINTHRLLVRGHRVELEEDGTTPSVTGEAAVVDRILVMPFLAVPILIILIVVVLVRTRRSKPGTDKNDLGV